MLDKNETKEEIIKIAKEILKKNNEPYDFDSVAVLNTNKGVSFIGSLRIYNDELVNSISKDLETNLNKFGKFTINNQRVTPCCEAPFHNISFELVLN
ncbi:hypothetical protein [Methanobrevibacter sp. DSM 116169]|uniref:hypothetical protein n=1 Tax=Methanobrevibacter sp. DSM 116169 TaxID=3242727 RepID=UPI0038FD3912